MNLISLKLNNNTMNTYKLLAAFLFLSISTSAQTYIDSPTLITHVDTSQGRYVRNVEAMWNKVVYVSLFNAPNGAEWWTYDGNTTVTPAPEVNPGANDGVIRTDGSSSIFSNFYTTFNNKIYFRGAHPTLGNELYEWDGTPNGMKLVSDLIPGSVGSSPHNFFVLGKYLFFVADSSNNSFKNLYQYDTLAKTITTAVSDVGDNPLKLAAQNQKLYVFFSDRRAISYTPTSGFTVTLNIPNDTLADNFVSYGDNLFFITGRAVLQGSITNNHLNVIQNGIHSVIPNLDSVHTQNRSYRQFFDNLIMPYDGKVFFWVYTDTSTDHGHIYYYDTTTKTTAKAPGLLATRLGGSKFQIVYMNKLYYRDEFTLVRYDGTKADTFLPTYMYNFEFTTLNNDLYFAGSLQTPAPTLKLYRIKDSATNVPSIQAKNFDAVVTLYPNPAKDIAHLDVNLQNATSASVSVVNTSGSVVYQSPTILYSKGDNNIHIPIEHLPTGNYFVLLNGKNNELLWSGKMIKQE